MESNQTGIVTPAAAHLAGGQRAGKTALVLSGGGSRGAYECGVWQAVTELGIRIDMVVGVSVGALNGAMVVQGDPVRTSNLWRRIETDNVFDVAADAQLPDYAAEFLKQGGASSAPLQDLVKEYLDEPLIRSLPVDFGLLTVEVPSMKPHYLWKEDIPEGKLGDYVVASASAFPAVQPIQIDGKYYVDGGFENVMPVHMAADRGATKVIAVYLKAVGKYLPEEEHVVEDTTLISPNWDLGSFLVFDRENSSRIMRLGYLDAMKAFEIYDGESYAFAKGAFEKKVLPQAEAAARIFELDPLILYRRMSFLSTLLDAVVDAGTELVQTVFSKEQGWEHAMALFKQVNKKTATLLIARNLQEAGNSSLFSLVRPPKALQEQVRAARFLVAQGLI